MRRLRAVRRNDVLLAAVVLAALALSAFAGRANTTSYDTFASSDVRSGGYAAWFALMQREGIATESFVRHPAELTRRIGTLIAAAPLVDAGGGRSRPDRAALTAWIAAGGQVVALSGDDGERPPVVLAQRTGGALRGPLASNVHLIAGLSAQRFRLSARAPAAVLLADRGGPIVVYAPAGRGTAVYVSDANPFTNGQIARADNARLAFLLAQPPRGALAFDETLHGGLIERSWWQALDVPERVALCGVALAVLIALIGGALRLGPPVTLRAKREPASDEFIAAIAALYERSKARRAALALFAAGAANATGAAAADLRALAERQTPDDRDLIAGARLARIVREGA